MNKNINCFIITSKLSENKREKKEELLENLEYKKPEKNFGIKETFAVLFTILFALVKCFFQTLNSFSINQIDNNTHCVL